MSDREIKDLYLDSLQHGKVRELLLPFLHLPLQQLQTKALDLSHGLKLTSTGQGRTTGKPNHQNPNRVQCQKCNWWYDKSKGETCKCPSEGRSNKPTVSRPRVQETTVEVEAAAVDADVCEVCGEGTCPGCHVEETPEQNLF